MGSLDHARIMEPWLKIVLGVALLTVGLFLPVGCFRLIRRAPWLEAVLAVSGIRMFAVLVYRLIVPLFIAAGASAFAIGWAKRQTSVG